MEFGGLDERISAVRLRAIRGRPAGYLRDWNPDAPSLAPSAGLRPMTPDGLPVIGRLRPFDHVYVASGHAMLGLTLAPRTGALVASMILDGGSAGGARAVQPSRASAPDPGASGGRRRAIRRP